MAKRSEIAALFGLLSSDETALATLAKARGVEPAALLRSLAPSSALAREAPDMPAALAKALDKHGAAVKALGATVPEGHEVVVTASGVTFRRRAGRPPKAAPAPAPAKAAPKGKRAKAS